MAEAFGLYLDAVRSGDVDQLQLVFDAKVPLLTEPLQLEDGSDPRELLVKEAPNEEVFEWLQSKGVATGSDTVKIEVPSELYDRYEELRQNIGLGSHSELVDLLLSTAEMFPEEFNECAKRMRPGDN